MVAEHLGVCSLRGLVLWQCNFRIGLVWGSCFPVGWVLMPCHFVRWVLWVVPLSDHLLRFWVYLLVRHCLRAWLVQIVCLCLFGLGGQEYPNVFLLLYHGGLFSPMELLLGFG